MISVDGTYLKGNYGDILLSVVALDANNEVFPIAFVVVSVEYKANWSYFLWNLYHIVKDSSKSDWIIISYRQKVCFIFFVIYFITFSFLWFLYICSMCSGNWSSFGRCLAKCQRRYYHRHLSRNYKKQFSDLLYTLFWRVYNSTS